MSLFYELQAEAKVAKADEPPAKTLYLVAAYNDGAWSIRRQTSSEEYLTRAAAEKAASELSAVWKHRTIIEIKLPGERA